MASDKQSSHRIKSRRITSDEIRVYFSAGKMAFGSIISPSVTRGHLQCENNEAAEIWDNCCKVLHKVLLTLVDTISVYNRNSKFLYSYNRNYKLN